MCICQSFGHTRRCVRTGVGTGVRTSVGIGVGTGVGTGVLHIFAVAPSSVARHAADVAQTADINTKPAHV